MTALVTVADQIYERQGARMVLASDGRARIVPAGQLPEPTEEVLGREGEPSFQVRLGKEVRSDDDVPDEVGLALRRVAERMYQVLPDGREVLGEEGPVEWVMGPAVHDGAVVMYLDTGGTGFSRAMIDTMVGVLVEELAPLAVRADITVALPFPSPIPPVWMSSEERRSE